MPFGPIPVTLQMLAIPLAIFVLRPSVAIAVIYGYVLLGALGIPVFSQMRGGLGVLLGPTGGFLMGYLIAVPIACLFLHGVRKAARQGREGAAQDEAISKKGSSKASVAARIFRSLSFDSGMNLAAGILFTVVADACGCLWFMFMMNVGLEAALMACVVPFIIPDLIKLLFASVAANALEPIVLPRAKRANV